MLGSGWTQDKIRERFMLNTGQDILGLVWIQDKII